MRTWSAFVSGIRSLLRPDEERRDLADEVQHYLREAEADLIGSGVPPSEARRRVRLEHGDGLSVRDDVRGYGWENAVRGLSMDLRTAWRRLRRRPGFTLVTVLTLGLGIGSSSAIFSAANPTLFRPLPYPAPDRILSIAPRADDGATMMVAFGSYLELDARDRTLEAVSVYKPWQPAITGGDEPVRLEAQRVSAAYFQVLGVTPALGRTFDAADDLPGAADVVLLGERLWRERFGSDPTIVGRTVRLDGDSYTVIGVLPAAFENVTAPRAAVWAPLKYDPLSAGFDTREWGLHLAMIARARPEAGPDEVRRSLGGIAANPIAEFPRPPWVSLGGGLSVRPLRDAVTSGERPAFFVLLGAVAVLLVIACVNVTVLLLARVAGRRGELAMRTALGAGRGRLARQLLGESVLLAALGGLLGIAVARVALAALTAVSPASLIPAGGLTLDRTAFLFALSVTAVVGVAVGLGPALTRPGAPSAEAIRAAGRGLAGRSAVARRTLVTAEVALAVVLLVGSGLLLRTTQRLFSIPPGFEADGLSVVQVQATGLTGDDADTHRFFDRALQAVEDVPGVSSAALVSQLPLSGDSDLYGVRRDPPGPSQEEIGSVHRYAVSPGYFATMGIPRVSGRVFEPGDRADAERVAIVSESLARRLAGDGDPIGRRVRVGGGPQEPPFTIVGVVGDVKHASLATDLLDAVYMPASQWHWADPVRWVVIRTDRNPTALVPAVRSAIWSVDPDQPITRAQSMPALIASSEAQRRFVLTVLRAFAILALVLAAVGLFGVLSESVAVRTRELGIRTALGASSGRILRHVLRQGMAMTFVGLAIGLFGAALASRALSALLFDVSRLDPLTYAGVGLLMSAVAVAACWAPAARASRADPLTVLAAD